MNPAYAFHKTLIPPTSVQTCTSAYLTTDYPDEKETSKNYCPDLVVVRETVLQLYHVIPSSSSSNSNDPNWTLELFFETTMFGNVMSVLPIRPLNLKRDFLMLSFKDAKISHLMWDEDLLTLAVVSLHYFEEEKLRSIETYRHKPELKIDPKQKCAVMLIYDRKLAVVPNRRYSGQTTLDYDPDKEPVIEQPSLQLSKTSSFHIDLSLFGITNVVDYVFLTGYFEPTILILYENFRTWAGRLVSERDTKKICAFSLKDMSGLKGKNFLMGKEGGPIIWKHEGLPYDAFKVVPVTLGGALILCKNQILYFNQNNKYGLYVNSLGGSESTPKFPMQPTEIQIDLDKCVPMWVTPEKLLISLRNGDLYTFQIFSDGRTITRIRPEKVGSSVLTSCLTFLGNSLIFFGSRLGDSILVKFKESREKEDLKNSFNFTNKKMKTEIELFPEDDIENEKNENQVEDDELDLMIYSSTTSGPSQLSNIKFILQDTLFNNIGPISDFCLSESFDPSSQSLSNISGTRFAELITCSNYGKHGSITILQEGIRPKIIKGIDIKDSKGIFTVCKQKSNSSNWLFLSKSNSTLVFSTDRGIHEIKVENFGNASSLLIENVCSKRFIIRVCLKEISLLNSENLNQIDSIKFEKQITAANIIDPYLLLHFSDDSMTLYQITSENFANSNSNFQLISEFSDFNNNISSCSLFEIDPDLFKIDSSKKIPISNSHETVTRSELDVEDEDLYGNSSKNEVQSKQNSKNVPIKSDLDVEDEELYGSSYSKNEVSKTEKKTEKTKEEEAIDAFLQKSEKSEEKSELPKAIVFIDLSGRIHFRFISNLEEDFWTSPQIFRGLNNIFFQKDDLKERKETQEFFVTVAADSIPDPVVIEVKIFQLDNSRFPHLFMRTNAGDLYIYQCYQNPYRGSISWKKIEHKTKIEPVSSTPFTYPICFQFSNISGRRGCFISGKKPYWGIFERNYLRFFPMNLERNGVLNFTTFDIQIAPDSFIYLTDKNLKISTLQTNMTYDSKLGIRKFPLKVPPHKIAYFSESNTFAVITSSKYRRVAEDIPEGYRCLTDQEFFPLDDKFELRLYTLNSPEKPGELKLLDKYQFEPTEHVLTMKICYLRSNQVNGLKEYLVVGTSLVQGEDAQVRGNALIFEIINPQASQYENVNSTYTSSDFTPTLKKILNAPQKGAVVQCCSLDGLLALSVGPKILLHDFSNGIDLFGLAFYDSSIFITEMRTVKNYILISDIHKSIIWLRWKESAKQFILFAKDYQPLNVYQCDFLFHDQSLHFLTADSNKNLQLFLFAPKSLESRGGQMLLCRADFHLGSKVQRFHHIRAANDKKKSSSLYVTIDGSIGYITPIDEIGFKRLLALQNKLNTGIPHFAGLNPKSFRSMKDVHKHYRNNHQQILDGDLLEKYTTLEFKEQKKLARQIGTSPKQILSNFVDISKTTQDLFKNKK